MKITSDTLKRIAAMPEQAMAAALLFLAEQLEADEAKRASNAMRQQRYRERHSDVTVTPMSRQSNGDVTPRACVEDNIINLTLTDNFKEDKKLSLSLSQPLRANGTNPRELGTNPRALGTNPRAMGTNPRALASEPEGFTEFWNAYPKRDGSADRKGAAKAFGAALKRASLTTILDGAQHFSEAMTARGKVGTEFVPQARTWLNGDRWNERYGTAQSADPNQAARRAILAKYAAESSS